MPFPLRYLKPSSSSNVVEPIPIENITDPHARRTAELRNTEIKKAIEARAFEQKMIMELHQALDQYAVLKQITTLTEEEQEENKTLTVKKIAKAMIAARRASEVLLDARVVMGAKGEEMTQ